MLELELQMIVIHHVGAGGQTTGSLEKAASAEPSFQRLILTLAYNCLVYSLKLRTKNSVLLSILLGNRTGRRENTRVNLNISLPATGPLRKEKGEFWNLNSSASYCNQ